MTHCWKDYAAWCDEEYAPGSAEWAAAFDSGATCMLPDGHSGAHEWTPDDQIGVVFKETAE